MFTFYLCMQIWENFANLGKFAISRNRHAPTQNDESFQLFDVKTLRNISTRIVIILTTSTTAFSQMVT